MPPHVIEALAEMGKAVLISQNLEKLLLEMFEFRKLHQDFDYAKKTSGVVSPESYKLALMTGVKRMREQKAIHASLDTALVKYIEDRHVLVHRWALQHGFPDYSDLAAWKALSNHSKFVSIQAANIFGFFMKYLAEYARPEVAARDYPTYQARMLSMFDREYTP